jgi:hypothetical protein
MKGRGKFGDVRDEPVAAKGRQLARAPARVVSYLLGPSGELTTDPVTTIFEGKPTRTAGSGATEDRKRRGSAFVLRFGLFFGSGS